MPLFRSKKSAKAASGTEAKRQSKSTFYGDAVPNGLVPGPRASVEQAGPVVEIKIEDYDDAVKDPSTHAWQCKTSRLTKTFRETVKDQDLLASLLQFMYSKDVGFLIKFWLDVDNFTEATYSRLRSYSMETELDSSQSPGGPSSPGPSSPQSPNAPISPFKSPTSPSTSPSKKSSKEQKISKRGSRTKFYVEEELALRFSRLSSPLQESIKQDAVNIYSKYIAKESSYPMGWSDEMRNNAIRRICSESGQVDALCFEECKRIAQARIEKEFFPEFLTSTFYRKHQVDILTSGDLHLTDVLYYEELLFYFMEFAEQEGASHLLQCWLAMDNFEAQLLSAASSGATEVVTERRPSSSLNPEQVQADAMIIYDKYFSLQARVPLGFSDKVRIQVELNICREGGPLPDCFLMPKLTLLNTVNSNYFGPFMRSQIYFRFLSELLHSVQTSQHQDHVPVRHKRSGSIASADSHSTDGQSLSASGSKRGSEVDLGRTPAPSGGAASGGRHMLSAPEDGLGGGSPLWTRSQASMTMGHVSPYGRFMSEYEPEPDFDKRKGSLFGRKRKEKEQTQEDMAWQVAQMIINDVKRDVNNGTKFKTGEG